jgi:YVTN family beta-propeller protein
MRLSLALLFTLVPAGLTAQAPITAANWGSVTTPVYGTFQAGKYGGAELFPGPNQFGYYYAGVLPNGRKVTPAGFAFVQAGMNPIACALTSDSQFLIVANSSQLQPSYVSYQNPANTGGYSLTVINNSTFTVSSEYNTAGSLFSGLVVTGTGPYTVYASGGSDSDVKIFTLSLSGILTPATPASIAIPPMLPNNAGFASNYSPAASAALFSANGYLPTGSKLTYPAGMQLSPDGRFLYVACNTDNSIAVLDLYLNTLVTQVPAGYFPFGVAVSFDGQRIYSTNWGVSQYQFVNPNYSASGSLLSLAPAPGNVPASFNVPAASPSASSVSIFRAPSGDAYYLNPTGNIPAVTPLDDLHQVGGSHPSSAVTVYNPATGVEMLYYTKSNSDSLGLVRLDQYNVLPDFDLSPVPLTLAGGHKVHGAYPSALIASPDASKLYVAESGINSVAVLDISRPLAPVLLGRIPTAWYPTALALTSDGQFLFIVNAKGIGEDINPQTGAIASDLSTDSNSLFGMVQLVYLTGTALDNTTVLANNYAANTPADTSVVPSGSGAASSLIKHVFVIVHENKTFDSVLGSRPINFGGYASQTFLAANGRNYLAPQFASSTPNTQALAGTFATAVNFYSDAEESNAGAQFLASGTATDYTEKTLQVLTGRGLLANRNAEPEDYPEGGYIFNNAARNGVTFKDYGLLTTLAGSDNGTASDAASTTPGLGEQYFLANPALAVLGEKSANGEPYLDLNYPGINVNISDQSRALEFIHDFDRMAAAGTLPQLVYIYQPNDAAGTAPQVSDGDTALGMVVSHIMSSPVYYNSGSNTGSAIFVTYTSSQTAVDHIHPHRNLLLAISPFAKPNYIATRHYSTASVVKTAELLLGLPPNNLGDLFATDLRDMFQGSYNGIAGSAIPFTKPALQSAGNR